jgi:hypothetical protein
MQAEEEANGHAEIDPDPATPRLQEFIHYTDEKGWRGINRVSFFTLERNPMSSFTSGA